MDYAKIFHQEWIYFWAATRKSARKVFSLRWTSPKMVDYATVIAWLEAHEEALDFEEACVSVHHQKEE